MDFIDVEKYRYKTGIYKIRNVVNNFIYIGQTLDCFWNRFLNHNNKLTNGRHKNKKLSFDWEKYGSDSFVFEVVCVSGDANKLDMLEKSYIKEYKDKNISYNKKNGGDHVFITEDGIRSVSRYMSSRVISKETRDKIRMANIGDNNPTRKICSDDVIEIKKQLIEHVNQKEIANHYGVSLGLISAIANGRSWNHIVVDGWEDYMNSKKPKHFLTDDEIVEIRELLMKGNLSQSEIARKYGVYSSVISSIYHNKTHNSDNTVPSPDDGKV